MLEPVLEPERIVATIRTLVKPGGQVFLSTLNRTFEAYLLAVVGAEYIFSLLPRGTHTYSRFIRPADLARWTRTAGLDVCELAGIEYNPVTRVARLSAGVDVNYLLHARRSPA